jgi:hypothetical protein
VAVFRTVVPSLKITVPVGTGLAGVTVAVKTTAVPETALAAELVSFVAVAVLVTTEVVTVTATAVEVEALKLLLPS